VGVGVGWGAAVVAGGSGKVRGVKAAGAAVAGAAVVEAKAVKGRAVV
jgi:hypothetical protein